MFDKVADYIKSILDNADITHWTTTPVKNSLYLISDKATLFITSENTNKILVINTMAKAIYNKRPRMYLNLSSPSFKGDLIGAIS